MNFNVKPKIDEYSAKTEKHLVRMVKERLANRLRLKYTHFLKDETGTDHVPPVTEIIKNLSYNFSQTDSKNFLLRFEYNNIKGEVKAELGSVFNPKLPTIINHHGLGNINHKRVTQVLVSREMAAKYNIITIKACFHQSVNEFVDKCVNKFSNIALTTAASIVMENELVNFCKIHSDKKILATGFSMGGIVASWHYFLYNTADAYLPVVSYPNFGEIIFCEEHKNFFKHITDIPNKDAYINCFLVSKDIQDARDKSKITVILGEDDELVPYKYSSEFWRDYNVKTFNTGHVTTIVVKINEIRKILEGMISA